MLDQVEEIDANRSENEKKITINEKKEKQDD